MNVLILTPDRVGSTLLQRLITVYMAGHDYDKPVINLHELTNGLMKYYSPDFEQEVLGKPNDRPWGYYQTLAEITDLLESTDHYKTARLAHYHIKNRADTVEEQVPFYQYLNDNFYIISARRENLLEHALSWCIYNESKRLNVFSYNDKINTFQDIYRNRITVDTKIMSNYISMYKQYLDWVEKYFTVDSYFNYDEDLPRIEDFILEQGIFEGQSKKKTWSDMFDIGFQDWNRCHYLTSDISGIGNQLPPAERLQLTYEGTKPDYQLKSLDGWEVTNSLSVPDQQFLLDYGRKYVKAEKAITELVAQKVLVTGIPIKLQTMLEKKLLIKNFDQCVEAYNQLVTEGPLTGLGSVYTTEKIDELSLKEITQWHSTPRLT